MRFSRKRDLGGEVRVGNHVEAHFGDGRRLLLTYKPHDTFDGYLWTVEEDGGIPRELERLAVRARRSLNPGGKDDWLIAYLNPTYETVVGKPLYMVLIPLGNMMNWPRAQTVREVRRLKVL